MNDIASVLFDSPQNEEESTSESDSEADGISQIQLEHEQMETCLKGIVEDFPRFFEDPEEEISKAQMYEILRRNFCEPDQKSFFFRAHR